jgi:photosystem II stability/assembly factor-like uncharacterized protein
MKTAILAFLFLILSTQISAQDGWSQQNSGTNKDLRSVCFVNSEIGWAVGYNGTILNTTNGGQNWVTQPSGTGNYLLSVYFVDSLYGWCVGTGGIILHTTNAGIGWTIQDSDTNVILRSVHFANNDTGIIVGTYGFMLRTTNAGNTWISQASGTGHELSSVRFADSIIGWEAGATTILKTTNAGIEWIEQVSSGFDYSSIFCIDSLTALAVAQESIYPFGTYLDKTTDGGENWHGYWIAGNFFRPYSVYFTDKNNGWVVGVEGFLWDNGKILKTSNGGLSWINQPYNLNDFLYSVCFSDSSTGWAVGDSGTILKTINGGIITGTEDMNTASLYRFALSQNYPNPFNPVTIIKFEIPSQARNDNALVTLKVFDILGREIATLVNEEKPAGEYEVEFNGTNLPNGIYFYRLKAGSFVETKKMVLIK